MLCEQGFDTRWCAVCIHGPRPPRPSPQPPPATEPFPRRGRTYRPGVHPASEVVPMPPSKLPDMFESTISALRQNYRDAIRLAAREEILSELAEDMVTAQLHADTARFHHGSARAYAKTIELVLQKGPDLFVDKREARLITTEADLALMRCQGRRYRCFDPENL